VAKRKRRVGAEGRRNAVLVKMWLKLIALAGAFLALLVAQEPSPAMRLQAGKTYLRQDVEFQSSAVAEAFGFARNSAGKAGGMVIVSGCGDQPRSPLRLPADSSLAAALDMIVSIFPTHYWTIQDGGAINLLLKQDMPPIMDFPIRQFEWNTAAFAGLTVGRLFRSKGVDDRLARLGMVAGLETGPGLQKPPRVINGVPDLPRKGQEQKTENLTLLQTLNAIVVSYGDGSWLYEEQQCGNNKMYRISGRSSM
jgi:hypothetical protein